jgi:hypothetical protein
VIKKGYACLEERQVREGDRKVTRKFV